MGVCLPKQSPTKFERRQKFTEFSQGVSEQKSLAQSRLQLLQLEKSLLEIQKTLDAHSKELIKLCKRGRAIYTLQKLRLYSNFLEDIHEQRHQLDDALLGVMKKEKSEMMKESNELISKIVEVVELQKPLEEGESLRDRQKKFEALFKKYHIQKTDVYHKFAEHEAEVHEITLTTSSNFQRKSEEKSTLPGSKDLESEEDEAWTQANTHYLLLIFVISHIISILKQ